MCSSPAIIAIAQDVYSSLSRKSISHATSLHNLRLYRRFETVVFPISYWINYVFQRIRR